MRKILRPAPVILILSLSKDEDDITNKAPFDAPHRFPQRGKISYP
jgi:hypothetical protein